MVKSQRMAVHQTTLTIRTRGQGTHEFTDEVARAYFAYSRSLQALLGHWDALRQEGAGMGVVGR